VYFNIFDSFHYVTNCVRSPHGFGKDSALITARIAVQFTRILQGTLDRSR